MYEFFLNVRISHDICTKNIFPNFPLSSDPRLLSLYGRVSAAYLGRRSVSAGHPFWLTDVYELLYTKYQPHIGHWAATRLARRVVKSATAWSMICPETATELIQSQLHGSRHAAAKSSCVLVPHWHRLLPPPGGIAIRRVCLFARSLGVGDGGGQGGHVPTDSGKIFLQTRTVIM